MNLHWRNLPEDDYFLVARSFRLAAKTLAGTLDARPNAVSEFDACPVLALYRKAVLLHLKVLVLGEGGNFLPARPDELSIHKSRSVSWLAQFVIQIVTALHWEEEFRCEGVQDIGEFRKIIEEVNAIDPAFHAFRAPVEGGTGDEQPTVREFLRLLDTLLDLLDQTADGLAAEWDLRSERVDDEGFGPTTGH